MKVGILGDLRRFTFDVLVGLGVFALIAVLVLDGEVPRQLPEVAGVLSMGANAAETTYLDGQPSAVSQNTTHKSTQVALSSALRFTGGWTALSVMAVMFAMLYAFNLALFRRFSQKLVLSRRRGFSTR